MKPKTETRMNLFSKIVCVLLFAILFSCTPEPERPAQLEDFDLQGHRGAMGMFAENTIPSFLLAIDEGVNTIEFDIAVSADDDIIISHEPWFRHDICLDPNEEQIPEDEEREHLIYELSTREVQEYDCGSLQNPDHPDQQNRSQPKPTMIEAIETIENYIDDNNLAPVYYSIETKSRPEWDNHKTPDPETFTQLMYDELAELDVLDRVIMQSFDPRTLRVMREIDDQIRQALLISRNGGDVEDDTDELGYIPEIYSPNYLLVTRQMVDKAHEKGMEVIPWTVNHTDDMEHMIELGVDGLLTDYPNRFNAEVREIFERAE